MKCNTGLKWVNPLTPYPDITKHFGPKFLPTTLQFLKNNMTFKHIFRNYKAICFNFFCIEFLGVLEKVN